MKTHWRLALPFALLGAAAFLPGWARAAAFPDRSILLVTAFPPGGAADLMARVVATAASRTLGQPVVVENKPGANSDIGAGYVAHSKPDGYTLFLYTVGLTYPQATRTGYDPLRSFAAITELAEQPQVVNANTMIGVKSFADLVAQAKAKPLRYGTIGPKTPNDAEWQLLFKRGNFHMLGIPYTGDQPIAVAMMGNEVQAGIIPFSSSQPRNQSGQLIALATTGAERWPAMPDVPTVAELLHYPEYDFPVFYGVVAPAGTPPGLVKTLHDEFVQAMATPGVKAEMDKAGMQIVADQPDQFEAMMSRQITFWKANAE